MDAMNIPLRAQLVFGQNWGGWWWLSISPTGRTVIWLAYFKTGEDEQRLIWFHSQQDFEQWMDTLDFIGGEGVEPKGN